MILDGTLNYLASEEAVESIKRDPYWPKWDSPWWHMTLLWELGEAARIPERIVDAMVDALNTHYLDLFPLRETEMPPDKDPYRHVACHCALGTMYRVLAGRGVDVDGRIPHLRPWFLRYQLADGGLNCDEAVYTKQSPHSSIVSTLPPLEAVLFDTDRPLTDAENAFLDRGADYLLKRKLFRSLSGGGKIIDEAWLEPCFPRFYHYDVLRGLRFVTAWADRRDKPLPRDSVQEAVDAVETALARADAGMRRKPWAEEKSLYFDGAGSWEMKNKAEPFELLEGLRAGAPLRREWSSVKTLLRACAAA
ncbi:MAG: hypothetical protein COB53_09690 [Elusimicrobia bacterium]|nr:MAG: hypothetical protein COB53_09690 [Elusimicrobiota bacterium]